MRGGREDRNGMCSLGGKMTRLQRRMKGQGDDGHDFFEGGGLRVGR